jgi:membrane associated rhomboid family serine protease
MNTTGASALIASLGASGAISGVLGGYLLMFPRRSVRILAFYNVLTVPALIAVGIWFVMQVIGGFGTSTDGGGGTRC